MNVRPADKLAIAVAQLNSTVGDIAGNAEKVRRARKTAAAQGADLVVFPELFIAGYPPEDLVLKPAFQAACRAAVEELARETASAARRCVVGTPWLDGGKLYNAVALLDGGGSPRCATRSICRITACSTKSACLRRGRCRAGQFPRCALGPADCEDIWGAEVVECLAETGAEMLVVPNGSPYWRQKGDVRSTSRWRASTNRACRRSMSIRSAGRTNWCSTASRSPCMRTVHWRSSSRHFRKRS